MRCLALVAIGLLAVGCASSKKKQSEPAPPPAVAQLAKPSAALAFDPPAAYPLPEEVLARDFRERNAYVGYDQTIATFSYVRTDDRQRLFDKFNDFERRAVSRRSTVSYR